MTMDSSRVPASVASAAPWAVIAGALWGLPVAWVLDIGPWLSMSCAIVTSGVVLGSVFALRRLRIWPHVCAAISGALACTGPLALLAQAIKSGTHHRPLGSATFAVIATLVVLGSAAAFVRAGVLVRGRSWERRAATLAAGVAATSCVGAMFLSLGDGWGWSIDAAWGAVALITALRASQVDVAARFAERFAVPAASALFAVALGAIWLLDATQLVHPSAIGVSILSAALPS